MRQSRFEILFGQGHRILQDSPELKFMRLITNEQPEAAAALFADSRFHGEGLPGIETPYGSFHGQQAILEMARGWYSVFKAKRAVLVPVTQTQAGSRSVTEFVLHYTTEDNADHAVPMAAVGELGNTKMLDVLRLYYNWQMVPDTPPYRPPVFLPKPDLTTRTEMLSGAIYDYFRYLHDPNGAIVTHASQVFADRACFGGYERKDQNDAFGPFPREDFVRTVMEPISARLSRHIRIRMETIIDDGKICCVEWEQLVTKAGREELQRLSQPGIAFYERDDTGRIWSMRVIDYAGSEQFIDWDKACVSREAAEQLNYIGK